MHRFILLLLLSASPLSLYSQCGVVDIPEPRTECQFSEDEVDEFTGAKKLSTYNVTLLPELSGAGMEMQMRKVDDSFYIVFTYQTYWNTTAVGGEDGKLMLKLANDSIVTGHHTKAAAGDWPYGYNGTYSIYTGQYQFDSTSFVSLARHPIRKVRIYFTVGYKEAEVKPKRAENVMEQVRCLLKH